MDTATRLAELSRAVDARELGRRLRDARIAAGLTEAQAAASDITPSRLAQIERGQRRPDFDFLQRHASRLGTTVESILDDAPSPEYREVALALDHAELALDTGDHAAALARIDTLTARLDALDAPGLRRRRDAIQAGALEAGGELGFAILILEEILEEPTPDASWIRNVIALSRCHRDSGNLKRAIEVGEDARATIAELGLSRSTEAIQLSVTVAYAHMLRGDLSRAMRLCTQAIDDAREIESPIAMASAMWNASFVHVQRGEPRAALDLAQQALAQFEKGEDARNLTRLRAQVASLQLQIDPPDAESALASLSLASTEMDWSAASAVDRAGHFLIRAKAHLILGDLISARSDVENSLIQSPPDAHFQHPWIYSLLGQIEMASGNQDAGREAILNAVRGLTAIGADREAAQLWYELGQLLQRVGETEAALDAFARAAVAIGLRPTR